MGSRWGLSPERTEASDRIQSQPGEFAGEARRLSGTTACCPKRLVQLAITPQFGRIICHIEVPGSKGNPRIREKGAQL